MDTQAEQFYSKVQDALDNERLTLPTLPEVALRIRDNIEYDDCSVGTIAELIAQDAALSASFIRIANSPIYRGVDPIDDMRVVISRMGLVVVKDVVTGLAMRQIFTATSDSLDKKMHNVWSTSVAVAAISRMLTLAVTGLSPEQALLAGLIHNIGILPILVFAEQEGLFDDERDLEEITQQLQAPIGQLVLEAWQFPEHLVDVVKDCQNFSRVSECSADYVDVVQVALIHGGYASNAPDDLSSVMAFEKLQIDHDMNVVEIEENQEMIEETQRSLVS